MPEPWYRQLAEVRNRFAARTDDLRHVLQTIDAEVRVVPAEWGAFNREHGFATWGMPHDRSWRQLPGEDQPRRVIDQVPEYGWPFQWFHTFYGAPALEEFQILAYRAVRCLVEAFPDGQAFLPVLGPPALSLQTSHLWWMRLVHRIALGHPPGTDLTADSWGIHVADNPQTRWDKFTEAREAGRFDVGEFSYSLLSGHVFEASAWAMDVLMGKTSKTRDEQPLADPPSPKVPLVSIHPAQDDPTGDEGPSHGADRVSRLILAMKDLRFYLGEGYRLDDGAVREKEEVLATKLRQVADCLHNVVAADFSATRAPRAGHLLRDLREWLEGRCDAWGWRRMIEPGPEPYMASRREDHDRRYWRPFLEAALSCAVQPELRCRGDVYDYAERARAAGYRPADPPATLEGLGRLFRTHGDAPLFGSVVPACEGEHLDALGELTRDLRELAPRVSRSEADPTGEAKAPDEAPHPSRTGHGEPARGHEPTLVLLRALKGFQDCFIRRCQPGTPRRIEDGDGRANERERDLLPRVRVLADCLRGITPADFGELESAEAVSILRELRGWLNGKIDAWGWQVVVSPEGESCMADRIEAWEANVHRPLMEAAIACKMRCENAPGWVASLARRAFKDGYRAVEGAPSPEEVQGLFREFERAPLFGSSVPVWEGDDVAVLQDFTKRIGDMIPIEVREAANHVTRDLGPIVVPPAQSGIHILPYSKPGRQAIPRIEVPSDALPSLVTLNQAAAMVHKSKRTLERHKTRGTLPAPTVEGGGGRADLWEWEVIRPWLEATFGIKQTARFPADRRS